MLSLRKRHRGLRALVAATAISALLVLSGAVSVGAEQRDVTASNAANGVATEYVVVYADGVSLQAARAAVTALGATIVKENVAVGVATVKTSNPNFLRAVGSQRALAGAARNRIIGYVPPEARVDRFALEKSAQAAEGGASAAEAAAATAAAARAPQAEPLASLQWDMQMIHATPDGSYAKQRGDRRVLVGVIDTGIDASHPDIAPNFNRRLSRNFTIDIPEVDGPCEYAGCIDPPDVDNGGHGTHVAGTIAAAINGLGVAGVAPKVTLVNIRAGQDSGYFFPQPTVDALTYAGDAGIDVVNMSFFIDPWLYNCRNNPADSPEAQMEQRTIITATQRAVDYARRHGVTLVAAEGNEATDLGHPTTDTISPDYPPDTAYTRTVNNSCLVMPTEARGVIAVSALGPSGRKSFYSNYGLEQTDVSAPGGDSRDTATGLTSPRNAVLAPYPENVLRAEGLLDEQGNPKVPSVIKDCNESGTCAYYRYLQGTSMASPHAAGVAALIVSEYGRPDPRHPGGLTMDPDRVERILLSTATDHPCPEPRLYDYGGGLTAFCQGPPSDNGFYGEGIVDALRAVTRGR